LRTKSFRVIDDIYGHGGSSFGVNTAASRFIDAMGLTMKKRNTLVYFLLAFVLITAAVVVHGAFVGILP
jgi:hypothetical protein